MLKHVLLSLILLVAPAFPQVSSATSTQQTDLRAKLEETIRDVDSRLDGSIGVSVLDLTSGDTIAYHADAVFPTASAIKLPLLAELYRQSEQADKGPGNVRLSDTYIVNKTDNVPDSSVFNGLTPGVTTLTLRDLAQLVVSVSDNSAANVLIDRVGMQNVNQLLRNLSLSRTKLQRKMMDIKAAQEGRENLGTPREFTQFWEAVYRNRIFSKQSTEEFLKLFETRNDGPMQRAFMYNVKIADKTGELDGVRCDVGIVFATNRPFVISIMTNYLKNEREGEDAISEIAQAAYSYFDRVGRSSPYGRAMQPPPQP